MWCFGHNSNVMSYNHNYANYWKTILMNLMCIWMVAAIFVNFFFKLIKKYFSNVFVCFRWHLVVTWIFMLGHFFGWHPFYFCWWETHSNFTTNKLHHTMSTQIHIAGSAQSCICCRSTEFTLTLNVGPEFWHHAWW